MINNSSRTGRLIHSLPFCHKHERLECLDARTIFIHYIYTLLIHIYRRGESEDRHLASRKFTFLYIFVHGIMSNREVVSHVVGSVRGWRKVVVLASRGTIDDPRLSQTARGSYRADRNDNQLTGLATAQASCATRKITDKLSQ